MSKIKVFLGAMVVFLMSHMAFAFPVQVNDARKQPVTIFKKAERVVTLGNFAADMMVALGQKPVGITTYEGKRPLYLKGRLDEAIDLGELNAPNLELLAKIAPDLTVGFLHYNGPFEKEITQISPFLAFDAADVERSNYNIREFAKALGQERAAQQMNDEFEKLRGEFLAKTPKSQEQTYLFLWHFYDTFYAYQDNLTTAELISGLGAKNLVGYNHDVKTAEEAIVTLDYEDLLQYDPDLLFVFSSHGDAVKSSPVFKRMKAIQNNRAYSLGYQYSQPDGPIARELVLREAAFLLYPDHFARPEMPQGAGAKRLVFAE